jgi:hypothetical protein
MDYLTHFTLLRVEDDSKQVLDLLNRLPDHFFGFAKFSKRYCRFETWTRYVPANRGSFLKSLESDVGVFQEYPINCKQAN